MNEAIVALTSEHTHQLLLAKYLYQQGAKALDVGTPMSAGLAVSLFQDAVELAIWTVAKDVDAGANERTAFMALWDVIPKARRNPSGAQLPMRGQIDDLNKARRNFKHNGQLPTVNDAIRFAGYADEFLREVVQVFYDVKFDDLSFADLIQNSQVAAKIKEASSLLADGRRQEAIQACAEARHHASHSLNQLMPRVDSGLKDVGRPLPREIGDQIKAGFRYVADHMTRHGDVLTALLLRIPISDFFRFRALMPGVAQFGNGKIQFSFFGPLATHQYSDEEVRFCIAYATDLALKVEEVVPTITGAQRSGTVRVVQQG